MRTLLIFSILLAACGDPAADTTPADPVDGDVCQAAADHLAACEGADPAPAASSCDPETAQIIVDSDCNALGAGLDSKADGAGFRGWACRAGLYRYCPLPVCEPEADDAEFDEVPAPEGSACLEAALSYQGCGACEYYACREATAQCGQDGYLLRFAEKYCLSYRLISEQHASPAGKKWLRDIRRCLVVSLDEAAPGDDCQTIETEGFGAHPPCYVSTGFCDLPISDWLLVLNTIDYRDANLREMLVTGVDCLGEWIGRD